VEDVAAGDVEARLDVGEPVKELAGADDVCPPVGHS